MKESIRRSKLNATIEDPVMINTEERTRELQILIAELLLENQLLRSRSEGIDITTVRPR